VEHSEREVYELSDLGYRRCPMVLASVDGEDRAQEAPGRLSVMRIATWYSPIADPVTHRSRADAIDSPLERLGAV
jgi:ATP phosphoribosyltransferase